MASHYRVEIHEFIFRGAYTQDVNHSLRVVSVMVTKATSGEPTTTASGITGRLRVALKYSSSSTNLLVRVVTESVTFTFPVWSDTLKEPLT